MKEITTHSRLVMSNYVLDDALAQAHAFATKMTMTTIKTKIDRNKEITISTNHSTKSDEGSGGCIST